MPSIPVRLSASLAARARKVARVEERSLTEQVEHWARLGELVEASVSGPGVRQLKTVTHDPDLRARLSAADTREARAKAERIIRARGGARHGISDEEPNVLVRHTQDGGKTRGRVVAGKFVAARSKR